MLADYTFIKEKHHLSYIFIIYKLMFQLLLYTILFYYVVYIFLFVVVSLIFYILIKNYIYQTYLKKNRHIIIYISFIYKKENILLIFLFPLFYYYDIVIKFIFIHRYISYRYIYYIYRIQNFSNHLFTDFTPDV